MAHIRRHPRSGRWQVRYRDPSGRERSKTFERKMDANRFAATVTADVLRADYIDPQAGKVTVGEFAARWVATRSHLAQSTRVPNKSVRHVGSDAAEQLESLLVRPDPEGSQHGTERVPQCEAHGRALDCQLARR